MTALDLRNKLASIFPDFESYWNSPDNLFREEQGSDTICGVFSAFSHFARERFASFQPTALDNLGRFVEQFLEAPDTELRNDCGACVLENMTSEAFTDSFVAHLGPRGKACIAELQGDAV